MVNRKWSDARSISTLSSGCSPHLEFLSIKCHPFYLPREFTSVIATVVYIPPQADTGMAWSELHDVLSSFQNKDSGAALIVAGDFNKVNFGQVMPNFYQHVSCLSRGDRIFDHCYMPYKQGYEAVSHLAFGKCRYRERMESRFQQGNTKSMWHGLRTITDYEIMDTEPINVDSAFTNELNQFYFRFGVSQVANAYYSLTTKDSDVISERSVISIAEHDIKAALRRMNTRILVGPESITGRLLRYCADQQGGVFTSIFNESLATSVVPTCFKRSTIIPVPKNNKPSSLNNYRPIALTSVVMKVFERLLKNMISSSILLSYSQSLGL